MKLILVHRVQFFRRDPQPGDQRVDFVLALDARIGKLLQRILDRAAVHDGRKRAVVSTPGLQRRLVRAAPPIKRLMGESRLPRIIMNAVRCKRCGEVIESKTAGEFVRCACGACAVDGGPE